MSKIQKVLVATGAAITAGFGLISTAFAQMTTSTLGASIDSVNGTTYDYFQVMLAKYWPFVVGFGVLLIVWHFGRRIIQHFS